MDGLLLMPLAVAIVLATSGLAKLRNPAELSSALTSLRLPSWLNSPVVYYGLPIAEIVLAVLLLVSGGWMAILTTGAVLVLMVAYAIVIGRALTFGYPVECGCFGKIGVGSVTQRTLWRNVLLVAMSVASLARSFMEHRSVLGTIAEAPSHLTWIAGTVAACCLAILIISPAPAAPAPAASATVEVEDADDDYVRLPTPPASLVTPDGKVLNIREMARRQAHVLVFVSPGCGMCHEAIRRVDELDGALGHIALRSVLSMTPERAKELVTSGIIRSLDNVYCDPDRMAGTALGTTASPSAVILGADDFLAGGPVSGLGPVNQLIDDVIDQLQAFAASES